MKAKVLESELPVVVDFNATWCGPCKMLGPRLDAAVAATEGKVITNVQTARHLYKFVQFNVKVHLAIVDIDELGDIAMDHDVSAVPTVVAVKEGKVVDKFVGLKDEDQLGAFVNKLL